MASHIPFVNSQRDCNVLKKYYRDSEIVRISLESVDDVKAELPAHIGLWIDPAIDSYQHILTTVWPTRILELPPKEIKAAWPEDGKGKKTETMKLRIWQKWNKIFGIHKGHTLLANSVFWKTKHFEELGKFVGNVLNECLKFDPSWLTVPQLPVSDKKERHKINAQLAQATRNWKLATGFKGKLILPLIFSNQRQLNRKPIRDDKLNQVIECHKKSGADGLWIVDSTLLDQMRNANYANRYSKLVEFHQQVREKFQERAFVIAGPYWGMNLVLWARELCDFPAVNLGTSYAYYISCGASKQGLVRLSIPPLRRWAVAQGLKSWLRDCLKKLSPNDQAFREFEYLIENFNTITDREVALLQVAQFQKNWYDKIKSIPKAGRALGLYQDLSAAFVLGKQLPSLPESALPNSPSAIREAGKVAEQLMLNCL